MTHPKKLHQEVIIWYVVPYIRKSIVDFLKEKSIKQVDIANFLDITPSAVSQYLHSKRGNLSGDFDEKVKNKIKQIFGEKFNLEDFNSRKIICELIYFIEQTSICCKIHREVEDFDKCCCDFCSARNKSLI